MKAPGTISGLRVAITRSPDRAGALADALAAAGADPVLVPLIDFELGEQAPLAAALSRLAAGEYGWLVISSLTTVRALKQWCGQAGTTLAALLPATTQVATIGPTSVVVLAAEGVRAALAPTELQSAAGLVELWPEATAGSNTRVLMPQSNLAADTLRRGIRAKGWEPDVITAYQTVDYPATPGLRLTASLNSPGSQEDVNYPQLTPAEAQAGLAAGVINAVVLASGSAARALAATMAPLPPQCLVIAIGQPTRDEAQRLGLRVAATATQPTGAGIVAALTHASNHFYH